MRRHLPAISLAALSIAFIAYVLISSTDLPDKVATHFNGAGRPNGWMSRSAHVSDMLAYGLGVPAFIVMMFTLSRHIPNRFINLPNRDYWLAPERKMESLDWLQRQGIWLACLMVTFAGLIHHSIIVANNTTPPALYALWPILMSFAFLAGTIVFLTRIVYRFSKSPETIPASS